MKRKSTPNGSVPPTVNAVAAAVTSTNAWYSVVEADSAGPAAPVPLNVSFVALIVNGALRKSVSSDLIS